ncbi:MAG: hypothetical protein SNJ52_04725 [Verrucomicrobiia bacterium]
MGLKTIHLLFVTLSTLLAFGSMVLLWSLDSSVLANAKVYAVAVGVFGIALIFYGGWFLTKIERLKERE